MRLLGNTLNVWSPSQRATLVTTVKSIYSSGIATIPDASIASLNSIILGFSSKELAQLVFTTTSSISKLGALSDWTADQVDFFNNINVFSCMKAQKNIFRILSYTRN
jgi:hypothetical protein